MVTGTKRLLRRVLKRRRKGFSIKRYRGRVGGPMRRRKSQDEGDRKGREEAAVPVLAS